MLMGPLRHNRTIMLRALMALFRNCLIVTAQLSTPTLAVIYLFSTNILPLLHELIITYVRNYNKLSGPAVSRPERLLRGYRVFFQVGSCRGVVGRLLGSLQVEVVWCRRFGCHRERRVLRG